MKRKSYIPKTLAMEILDSELVLSQVQAVLEELEANPIKFCDGLRLVRDQKLKTYIEVKGVMRVD